MKKIFAIATTLTVAAMIAGPGTAQAITTAELQAQINALLAQLSTLQSQLASLGGGGTSPGGSCTFTRNLYPEMSGTDVKCLQQYLNSAGFTLSASGAGSPGNETEYFGPRTQAAAKKWQDANGVVYGAYGGYFGPKSIAKYNTLGDGGITAVCGNGTCESGETSATCPADCPVGVSGLSVALAPDTPVSVTVADNANANFTKFTLTAGSSGDVKISKIYVKRTGLSANADIENVKVVDVETGEYKGSIGSFNVDNRAMITFVPNLTIPAGTTKTFYIRAGITNETTAGKTAILGIASNDDIVSNATSVSGAPIAGNAMSVVTLTIGEVSVYEDGTTVDSKPDVGDTDVIALKFYVLAGSTEPITVETITVMKTGTSDISDTANIELYSVTQSKSLGEVATWSSDEKATWSNLNMVIQKGKKQRLQVRLDILDNPSKTIQPDITDGSDVLVTAKGNTYGFYITPSSANGNWGGGDSAGNGKGTNPQTINTGSLVITKSASSPATGNVAAGDEIVLGIFDFEARGEEVKVSAIVVDFSYPAGLTDTDFTNAGIYDEDGTLVAGPVDVGDSVAADAVFGDIFIVPTGTHEYSIRANLADSASNGDAFYVGIVPGDATAKGMTSNESIVPTPSTAQNCNTLTVAAATLTITTLNNPASRSIPSGLSDFLWATFSFDAGASGEDVQVTSINITDSMNDAGTYNCIDNAEIWADLTTATSSRGDIYETKISDTEQPACTATTAAAETSFTLNQTLTIPKGTFVKLAYLGDIVSGASGSHSLHIAATNDITSNGADTGKTTLVSAAAITNRQTMTLATKGALTVTYDSSTPKSAMILEDETSILGIFRLAASNVESFDLDQITISASNGNFIETFYFYNGDDLLGAIPGGTEETIYFADETLTIPANGYELITVKGKPYPVDGSVILNDSEVTIAFEIVDAVQVTGLASGAEETTSDGPAGNMMFLFETRPYVTVDNSWSSGNLGGGSKTKLAVFTITAGDNQDVILSDTYGAIFNVRVDARVSDTTTSTQLLLQMQDEDDNIIDSEVEVADSIGTGIESNQIVSSASAIFSFGTNSLTIPAGESKDLIVYGDTADFEDEGDYIRVWLDNVDEDFTWAIEGVAAGTPNRFTHGYMINKGDPTGPVLTTP